MVATYPGFVSLVEGLDINPLVARVKVDISLIFGIARRKVHPKG